MTQSDETAVVEVIGLLNEMGSIAWCLNLAQVYRKKALAALSGLSEDSLEVLGAYV
jgi:geranylgeranyl pyrophosphate synthase